VTSGLDIDNNCTQTFAS